MNRREILTAVGASIAARHVAHGAVPDERPLKHAPVEGCTALVTGSNQGIGRGFVEVLLARGAKRVYATARRPQTLAEIVALDPERVVAVELDVTSDAHRRAAALKATDVTWLINNAGTPGSETAAERHYLSAANLDDAPETSDYDIGDSDADALSDSSAEFDTEDNSPLDDMDAFDMDDEEDEPPAKKRKK